MKRGLLVAVVLIAVVAACAWLFLQTAPLGAITRGGPGPPTLVLLHGYGSNAADWLQFEQVIEVPRNGRLVFPQGPLRGLGPSRGWWWLNIEGHIPDGQRLPDFSAANPAGLKVASWLVRDFLENQPGPVVLGGFSQGAMLTAEIAFQTDQPLAGIVLLAGTSVNEAGWAESFPRRQSLPVFIAHGRWDGVLPFAIADRLQKRLREAGMNVTWLPYRWRPRHSPQRHR